MSARQEVNECLRRRGQFGEIEELHIARQWSARRMIEEIRNHERLVAYRSKRAALEGIPAMPTAKGGA